ncbi:NYN domain-containing protein [Variovorax sp. UC74_104]|uniref:NYN domain-containing protein n=1 Tax=Variovorax sp. UC74_104 TaxID=3374555 RepID=UPI0037572D86
MTVPSLRVMLLIDADNVSAEVIEQAVERTMDEYGAIHVRRAYCNAEMAVNRQALFKRLSVRPMVNLSAGKNSTDIALSVDAIDLAIAERPDVVVLVSSDSDFAPLVIRLREKGCRVCGIGQQGKTGEETIGIYDAFTDIAHNAVAKPAARTVAAKKTAAAKTTRAKAAPAAKKTATKTAARKTAKAAGKAEPRPEPQQQAQQQPQPSEAAEFILQAAPALRSGKDVPLNDVAKALRTAGLLGKNSSSLKLFEKLTAEFALMQHPDRIRWTGAPAP